MFDLRFSIAFTWAYDRPYLFVGREIIETIENFASEFSYRREFASPREFMAEFAFTHPDLTMLPSGCFVARASA